jgi:hypothetical protein
MYNPTRQIVVTIHTTEPNKGISPFPLTEVAQLDLIQSEYDASKVSGVDVEVTFYRQPLKGEAQRQILEKHFDTLTAFTGYARRRYFWQQ